MILKRYGCEKWWKKFFKKMVGGEKIFNLNKNEKIEIMNPPEGGGEKK